MSLAPVIQLPTAAEQYLSKQKLAERLGFTTRWVEYRMREGMPFHRHGSRPRFLLSEVTAWLEGGRDGR